MNQLNSLRHPWEKGVITSLEFPQNRYTLFVIAEFEKDHFELFRYFFVGSKWVVSVDCTGELRVCVSKLSEMMKVMK